MTAGENDRHEAEEEEEEEASSTNFLHNSHWIKDPHHSGPSRYVGYYDAASLYPSSSEFFFSNFFFCFDRIAERELGWGREGGGRGPSAKKNFFFFSQPS